MNKYILAEKLKYEIERLICSIENCPFIEADFGASEKREGMLLACKKLLSLIASLQQEQQEEPDKSEEAALTWHKSTENPKDGSHVLAEVKGFKHSKYVVLMYSDGNWWQHIPRMNDIMPSDGWIGTQGLFVVRWAHIEEEKEE